jgi:MAF protein
MHTFAQKLAYVRIRQMTDQNSLPESPDLGDVLFILASASPRRKELLELTGLEFEIRPVTVDETSDIKGSPFKLAQQIAYEKASEAVKSVPENCLVLTADTVVINNNDILGKPETEQDAVDMLMHLRDGRHDVITSLVLVDRHARRQIHESCTTNVPMRAYTDPEIENYVASGSPMDKAGAYGIQDDDPGLVEVGDLSGCFANVMGLPICHFTRAMQALDRKVSADVPANCRQFTGYDCPVYEAILMGEV